MEPMIDAKLVKQRIAARADDFIETLFGDGAKRDGADKWRIGGRGSLAVTVKDGELVFFSHEDGTGSDAIALWQRERGGSAGNALRACADWVGVGGTSSGLQPVRPARAGTKKHGASETAQAPPLLAGRDLAEATAAAGRLAGDAELCQRIAGPRGWRADTLRSLCHEPSLGWHGGKLAFIYETGMKVRWDEAGGRQVRWHFGKPWLWRGQFTEPSITHAILTEGETDAIALINAGAEADGQTLVVAMPSAGWGKYAVAIWRERFRGRAVTLCFDADKPGQDYTDFVGGALCGIAAKVDVHCWQEIAP